MDSLHSFMLGQVAGFHVMKKRSFFSPHVILIVWHFANVYRCLMITCWPIPSVSCSLSPSGVHVSLSSKLHFYFAFLIVQYNCPLSKHIFSHCEVNMNGCLYIKWIPVPKKYLTCPKELFCTWAIIVCGSPAEAAVSFGVSYFFGCNSFCYPFQPCHTKKTWYPAPC